MVGLFIYMWVWNRLAREVTSVLNFSVCFCCVWYVCAQMQATCYIHWISWYLTSVWCSWCESGTTCVPRIYLMQIGQSSSNDFPPLHPHQNVSFYRRLYNVLNCVLTEVNDSLRYCGVQTYSCQTETLAHAWRKNDVLLLHVGVKSCFFAIQTIQKSFLDKTYSSYKVWSTYTARPWRRQVSELSPWQSKVRHTWWVLSSAATADAFNCSRAERARICQASSAWRHTLQPLNARVSLSAIAAEQSGRAIIFTLYERAFQLIESK